MKPIHWLLFLFMLGACRDKYNSPVHVPASGYLVVDGFINAGVGATEIILSRAVSLDSPYINPELGAQVNVESANGDIYPLVDTGKAHYVIDQIPVVAGRQYRLRIRTSAGTEYLSDFVSAQISPPIDSVSWKPVADGLQIYVSTHGGASDARNFQWSYMETWMYHSSAPSAFIYQAPGMMVMRPDPYELFTCWTNNQSTNIAIASSAKLTQNVIYEYPLTFISYYSSDRLGLRYSILVKQHALSDDWYEWKQRVQKNTEQLGSIFDAQPSDITGNIHNTASPLEPVIGFIGCTTETQQRIFIDRGQLPFVTVFNGYGGCEKLDTIVNLPDSIDAFFKGGTNLAVDDQHSGTTIVSYSGTSVGCIDCRIRGGYTTKPDFWQ